MISSNTFQFDDDDDDEYDAQECEHRRDSDRGNWQRKPCKYPQIKLLSSLNVQKNLNYGKVRRQLSLIVISNSDTVVNIN